MTSHPDTGPRRSGLTRLLTLGSLLWLGGLLTVSQAQITLDGSLGPRGPLTGPNYRIGAEVGQIRGGNLFHSFGEFNVPRGGSATFAGPNTIANIVSRVTGGQPSAIDGLLRSEIAGANLFLLNPSGVLFRPNARLDVRGSFHVSTADFLRFADRAQFFATLGQASVLTVAEPAAFGFLGPNPAAMTIQESVLRVPTGQTLSLVGGDITIVGGPLGFLSAPGGRIQLASVASAGEVGFSRLELAPELRVDGVARLGRITLSQEASLDVRGNGGGTVLLRSGQLMVDRSEILAANTGRRDGSGLGVDLWVAGDAVIANNSRLTTDNMGAGRARDLRLTAGSLHIDNAVVESRPFPLASGDGGNIIVNVGTLTLTGGARIASGPRRFASGNSGDIIVNVGTLTLTGGALITSGTPRGSEGRGGDLTVEATESITLAGRNSGLFSSTFGPGDAGRLFVSTPLLTITEGAVIGSETKNMGRGGDIQVEVGQLTLTGGAQINSSTESVGRGGDLTVEATEAISVAGLGSGLFSSTVGPGDAGRLVVSADTSGSGNAGRIALSTPRLTMDDGLIFASSLGAGHAGNIDVGVRRLTLIGGAQISTSTFGEGRGGDVTVAATEAITISGRGSLGASGLSSNAFSSGEAGRLVVSAPTLSLDAGGTIRAAAERGSSGNAGSIEVQVERLMLSGGAQLSTSTRGTGRGGELRVVATDALAISGRDAEGFPSGLFSTTAGPMPGGNLQVTAPHIQISDRGTIAASSSGAGDAGTIALLAGETFRSQNGRVTTATEGAGGGAIALRAGRLVQLQDSEVTTSIRGGAGDAGNLTLTAPSVIAEGSRVIAQALAGMGGRIDITADVFLADPASQVSASSTLGIQGIVDIQAPVTTLSGTLAPLPQAFVNVAALLPARCAARAHDGRYSSLVLGGRDGLPVDPGGLVPSPRVPEERLVADPALRGAPQPPPSAATFALLAAHEQALPRLGCPQ